MDIKGESDGNTTIVGDFNTPRTPMDTSSRQKIQINKIKKYRRRSSHRGTSESNLTRNHEVVGLIPGLTQ